MPSALLEPWEEARLAGLMTGVINPDDLFRAPFSFSRGDDSHEIEQRCVCCHRIVRRTQHAVLRDSVGFMRDMLCMRCGIKHLYIWLMKEGIDAQGV